MPWLIKILKARLQADLLLKTNNFVGLAINTKESASCQRQKTSIDFWIEKWGQIIVFFDDFDQKVRSFNHLFGNCIGNCRNDHWLAICKLFDVVGSWYQVNKWNLNQFVVEHLPPQKSTLLSFINKNFSIMRVSVAPSNLTHYHKKKPIRPLSHLHLNKIAMRYFQKNFIQLEHKIN